MKAAEEYSAEWLASHAPTSAVQRAVEFTEELLPAILRTWSLCERQ